MPNRAPALDPDPQHAEVRPWDLAVVRVFAAALALLLVGYMFLGRGLAHLGLAPFYVGEIVLAIGVLASAIAIVKLRPRVVVTPIVVLLLVFMALGALRTFPYLGTYGTDALRDGVLWGYAVFALALYVLADRAWVSGAFRLYGWVVPAFALWLPIAWQIWLVLSRDITTDYPAAIIPLVYYKAGDMAVHTVGSIAYLVLGVGAAAGAAAFIWRYLIAQSMTWTIFLTGTISRGALAASAAGLAVLAINARLTRTWVPVLVATALLGVALLGPGLAGVALPTPTPTVAPTPSGSPVATPTPTPVPTPTPEREVSARGWLDNLVSIFTRSSLEGQEGTKNFRLAWWKAITDYTVFGPYFWTGKGFGINLADDDGFQPTLDHSLRAPHNSHMTVLARMGVPGFVLWVALQVAFLVGLLRAILWYRRNADLAMAAIGAWILVYWVTMMVDTSFDPYLEGPQGGIWFWSLFGLGLVYSRRAPQAET